MALFERGPQGPAGPPGKFVPPGTSGDVFVNNAGAVGATSKLTRVDDEINHSGKPQHNETWSDFKVPGRGGLSRSQWPDVDTADDTPTILDTIDVSVADHGDCIITVIAEMVISYDDSGTQGGNRAAKATFKRSSGVLTRIGIDNLSSPSQWTGTVIGGLDIATIANDSIKIEGTGIADTDMNWKGSVHVILSKLPA